MNPQPELQSETLRSEIDTTRERMDDTIDALGNRLEGRHLVDELIGFFRGKAGGGSELRERLSHSAGTAMHSVADTVKAHPIPVALAGAGIAWLIYEMRSDRRRETDGSGDEFDYSGYSEMGQTEEGLLYAGAGAEYDASADEGLHGKVATGAAQAKGKISEMGAQAKEKAAMLAQRGREALGTTKDRLAGISSTVQERGREVYQRTRERVATTTEQHPLEVGLACLAAGVIVGLMLPTPQVVNRKIGPTVDRLRDRARDASSELLEKGKRVAQAAASAAKVEAKTQGITVPPMSDQGGSASSSNVGVTGNFGSTSGNP